jgi:hypothetical protein
MSFTADEKPEVNAGQRPNDRTATVRSSVDGPCRPGEPVAGGQASDGMTIAPPIAVRQALAGNSILRNSRILYPRTYR